MVTTINKKMKRQVINKILEDLQRNISERGIDAYKYCGIIDLINDPVSIQKSLRNEWKK